MIINFDAEFADVVRTFHKRYTLRCWKQKVEVGSILHLWINLRSGHGEFIGEVPCTEVVRVQFGMQRKRKNIPWAEGEPIVLFDGVPATIEERVLLAHSEHFKGTREMINWYRGMYFRSRKLPAGGLLPLVLIKW